MCGEGCCFQWSYLDFRALYGMDENGSKQDGAGHVQCVERGEGDNNESIIRACGVYHFDRKIAPG
ncbi:hypothetical protein BIW11_03065 [Tropilaelaps mercedesae]|uniref:Uncharacterized protein n=1 Tax=Tropilaelaps mercedesae TaxID=418985 RepID=A0A1V9XSS0_9ACAR|nr:hypothetical protein BIW11_03065 [Tropilaelaps mercedesae]